MPTALTSIFSSLRERGNRQPLPAARPGQPPIQLGATPESLADVFERERVDMENLRRLIAFTLRPDSRCVDVGANQGAVLHEIVRVAPLGSHIAYEPIPALADALKGWFPQVDVHQAALSNTSGTTTFEHVRGDAEGCSGFVVCTAPQEFLGDIEHLEVEVERLDDTVAGATIALIKIDVEGAEQQVLEGAVATLARCQPTVVFEHTFFACNAYGTVPDDVFDLLAGASLRIFDLNGNGPFSRAQFDEASRRGDPVNFVAHV